MNPFCDREWAAFYTRLDIAETRVGVFRPAPEGPDHKARITAATVRMLLAQIAGVSRART